MKFNLKKIESILVEQDPEGLIIIGAPNDEYEYEAKIIYSRLSNEKIKDEIEILIKIVGVFFESFGSSSACDNSFNRLSAEEPNINFRFEYIKNINIIYFYNIAKLIYNSAEKE